MAGLFTGAGGRLGEFGRYAKMTARLMIGVPDYGTYVEHMRRTHPQLEPMSYEAFFRDRQAARYAAGNGRSCC